jgi:hypothetical protein
MKKTTQFKILFYLILCFSTTFTVSAQNDYYPIITGVSTSGNGRAPQGSRNVTRSVWLLTAAEMTAAGYATGDLISGLGFTYQTAQDIPTTGTFVVYLQNTADATNLKSTTWNTAITGMTTASNGSATIPNSIGEFNYVFNGGTSFTYTGGALYVAFDYQNLGTLSTTGNVAYCNTSLTSGLKGALSAVGSTTPPATVAASNFRPETRLAKPVGCSRPVSLSHNSNSTTLSSAVLSWNPVGGSNVELQYGAYDFTIGSGTSVSSVTSPYTVGGLTDSSVYDFYVRTVCGTGSNSLWNGPYAFNTQFVPATLPYNTSFEQDKNEFIGWATPNAIPLAGDWSINNFGAGTLVQNGVSSLVSVTPSTAAANNWIFTRGLNLTAGSLVTITYYISNYQATSTATGSYQLTVGNAQSIAAQTQVIATETGLNSAAFTLKTFSFTPSTSGVYYLGLQNTTPLNAAGTHALIVDNFSVSQVLSNDKFVESSFSIYPNPVKNILNIQSELLNEKFNVQITDINGRTIKVLNSYDSNLSVDMSDLQNGIYFVSINTNKGKFVKKIIKQ